MTSPLRRATARHVSPAGSRQPAAAFTALSPSNSSTKAVSDLARLDLAHHITNKAKSNKRRQQQHPQPQQQKQQLLLPSQNAVPDHHPSHPGGNPATPARPAAHLPTANLSSNGYVQLAYLDSNKPGESEETRPKADSSNYKDPQKPHPISMESDVALRGGRSDVCPGRFCFCVPCPIPCDFCII